MNHIKLGLMLALLATGQQTLPTSATPVIDVETDEIPDIRFWPEPPRDPKSTVVEKDEKAPEAIPYSINLIWLNKKLDPHQQYIYPARDEAQFKKEFVDRILNWSASCPDAVVNIWYDGDQTTPQAVEKSEALLKPLKDGCIIDLRNIQDLELVAKNPMIFSDMLPVYFRVDLLRAIAAYHVVSNEKPEYFVYGDLDMKPMTSAELFDNETITKLKKYGMVMAQGGHLGFENGFQIVSSHNKNLLKAMKLAIIDLNIRRGESAIREGGFPLPWCDYIDSRRPMMPLQQIVYDSYGPMFGYFYSLEGLGALIHDEKPYDESDWLFPFGLHRFNTNLRYRSANLETYNEKLGKVRPPTKKVALPPARYDYD